MCLCVLVTVRVKPVQFVIFTPHLHVFGCSEQTRCNARTQLMLDKQPPVALIATGAEVSAQVAAKGPT